MTSVSQPLTLHAALVRAFLTATLPEEPYRALTGNPEVAADVAERIAEARADERRRCGYRNGNSQDNPPACASAPVH